MPELPEIETLRSQIAKKLPLTVVSEERSKVITSLTRKVKSPELFSAVGKTLYKATRYGKVLMLHFKDEKRDDYTLICGCGMSGGWRIADTKITVPHTHLQWKTKTSKNKDLYLGYVDPRRFGSLGFLDAVKIQEKLSELGVDVSSKEFSVEYLEALFKRFPNKEIKPFLLDQKYFAGIGNYIASEICARAGIMPDRMTGKIKKAELSKIVKATEIVLTGSSELGGLTFSGGYYDTTGSDGGGLQHLVVFHQKICGLCKKTEVKKIEMATRGTFFCPKCQK